MSPQSEEFSLRRARLLTLLVLMVVAAAIALANLSSEPLTVEFLSETVFKGKPAQRAFGWPLNWYWRTRIQSSASRFPVTSQWPVSRYSGTHLAANAAMWGVMLAVAAAACWWLLRRYRPRLRWRPRITTLLALALVLALIVLVNLSFDVSPGPRSLAEYSNYGWPLIWYWRVYIGFPGLAPPYEESDYSAAALAGNLALWLTMLAATAFAWERLTRRYPPRLRFSLRTMLAGVALTAALCGWYVAARDRADKQDAFVEWLAQLQGYDDDSLGDWSGFEEDGVYVERRGPKWLGVIGADRLCRHIVGVRVATLYSNNEPEENRELFKRLARLPSLRFLDLEPDTDPHSPRELIPEMTAILGEMQQLRMLNFQCRGDYRLRNLDEYPQSTSNAAHEYLAAIGKLTRLERLRLSISTDSSRDLACLSDLTNLKTLALDIYLFNDRAAEEFDDRESDRGPRVLGRLPVLPRLEELDLHNTPVGDEDLGRLAGFDRLKSLHLSLTSVSDAGLAKLAPLESLEEVAIDAQIATAAGFEALVGLKHLRKVHIAIWIAIWQVDGDRSASLTLDNGQELAVAPSELDRIRRAIEALRQSHPGIVIDGNDDEFEKRIDLEPPWSNGDPSEMQTFMQRWLYER
ncbi:MAG TPA: hypothetical protein VMV10_22335 [Pirellulales bacterium]|nr:hypothetical protein [Pirellulales bacterium]